MIVRTPRDIGVLIRDARRTAGLTQAELATRNSVTTTWLSWVENGKATAEIGKVLDIVNNLGISMDFSRPGMEQDHDLDSDKDQTDDQDVDADADDFRPKYTI